MNGAEALARTLAAAGIDTCFANPGTSEMHFVSALDRVAGLKCVLGACDLGVLAVLIGLLRRRGEDPRWALAWGWSPLIAVELGVGEPGVVIDDGVHVVVADAVGAVPRR